MQALYKVHTGAYDSPVGKTEVFAIRLDPQMMAKLSDYAEVEGRNRNNLLTRIIQVYITDENVRKRVREYTPDE